MDGPAYVCDRVLDNSSMATPMIMIVTDIAAQSIDARPIFFRFTGLTRRLQRWHMLLFWTAGASKKVSTVRIQVGSRKTIPDQ